MTDEKRAAFTDFAKSKKVEVQHLSKALWQELAGINTPKEEKVKRWKDDEETYRRLARRIITRLHKQGVEVKDTPVKMPKAYNEDEDD